MLPRLVRDVLTLSSGKLGAALVSLASAPFIARLFNPEHFGTAALFIAVVTPVAVLLPLAYQNAIVIPKYAGQAKALVRTAIISSLILTSLAFLLVMTGLLTDLAFPFKDSLGGWLWTVPVVSLVLSISLVCEGWLTRTRGFTSSAKATFGWAVVTSGGRLSTGALWGTSIWGLMVPYIVGAGIRLSLLARAVTKRWDKTEQTAPVNQTAREFWRFPVFILPAGFLRVVSDSIPVLFFAPVFGAATAGFYAMANRLIKAPATMGAMSVRRVYMQRAAQIHHRGGDLKRSYTKITSYLLVLGLPPLVLLMLVGQPLVEIVLGERWAKTGVFAEIIGPWLYLVLVSCPASALVVLLGKQHLWLWVQVSSTVLRVLVMFQAWRLEAGEIWVLWGYVIGGMPPYLLLMIYTYMLLLKNETNAENRHGTVN